MAPNVTDVIGIPAQQRCVEPNRGLEIHLKCLTFLNHHDSLHEWFAGRNPLQSFEILIGPVAGMCYGLSHGGPDPNG